MNTFYTCLRLLSCILVISLSSCTTYKELVYLEDNKNIDPILLSEITGSHEPLIMPNDILSITVNSEIKGAADDFNLPLLPSGSDDRVQTLARTSNATTGTLQNYLVDKNGTINFPILGNLELAGMTISEAEKLIEDAIYPHYIAKKPIINIRQLNFSVSVLGEVAKPGIYKSDNGQITILDALAAAGDMTIFGKRENVLLVRTQPNGEFAFYDINLRDRNIAFDKELFYLQQNDKIYVQANKARGNSSRFGTLETIGLSSLSVIISIIAIATR